MQATPATVNDSIKAGPVLSCAVNPTRTKIPVPMIAPTPRLVRVIGPRTRRRRFSPFISSNNIESGLVLKRLLAIDEPRPRYSRLTDAASAVVAIPFRATRPRPYLNNTRMSKRKPPFYSYRWEPYKVLPLFSVSYNSFNFNLIRSYYYRMCIP